jgi:5'-nucleotidase / UDP-sugar diphosphatase
MRRVSTSVLLLALLALLPGCAGTRPAAPGDAVTSIRPSEAPGRLEVVLLHMNDVYEITPIEDGRVGGLARVAALRQRLLAENPHVVTLIGGDLFSPSAMGTAKVGGEALDGEQMVAVLDAVGLDWATFGNHEFDISEEHFDQRMREAGFGWVSANVTGASGQPIPGVVRSTVFTLGEPGGPALRLGLVGGTLQGVYKDYVTVADPLPAITADAKALRPDVDVLVALTHLDLDEDTTLAETVPEIDLILGGHEHENWAVRRGSSLTPILKADANVRTVYVVRLAWDPATGDLSIRPELVPITDAMPEDPAVAAEVQHWVDLAFAAFRAEGFEPDEPVTVTDEELDGRAAIVRNRSNTLTDLIAEAMLHASPGADAAVYNSGSIRIDDVLPAGRVTQYDVIRVLPFGGDVVEVEISGTLLGRVLDQGVANRGDGGFLQYAGITRDDGAGGAGSSAASGGDCDCGGGTSIGTWTVAGAPLDDRRTYRVAFTDFLLTGREEGLGYLTGDNPDVKELGDRGDIRRVVITELRRRYGSGSPAGTTTPSG